MSNFQKTTSSSSNESLNFLRIGPGTDFFSPSNAAPLPSMQMKMFDINNQSTIEKIGSSIMYGKQSLLASMPFINQTSKIFLSKNTTDNKSSSTAYLPARNLSIQDYLLMNETCNRALSKAKLKQSSNVSALLSGFALVAMVEMDINNPSTIPLPVLIFFIITTTLLVSVHMIALMISTCILPHIESMKAMQDLKLALSGQENSDLNYIASMGPAIPNPDQQISYTSTHQTMHWYISIAWFFSTVIGIFLFILELVAIVWVKFWDHNHNENEAFTDGKLVATVSTFLLVPVLLSLIYFAIHFYRKLVLLQFEMTQKTLEELTDIADGLYNV